MGFPAFNGPGGKAVDCTGGQQTNFSIGRALGYEPFQDEPLDLEQAARVECRRELLLRNVTGNIDREAIGVIAPGMIDEEQRMLG